MKNRNFIAWSIALLLAVAASAQEQHQSMPGMQMPGEEKQQKTKPEPKGNSPKVGPPGAPGMQTPQGSLSTIELQQQNIPREEMKMENMEMRSAETTPSRIIGLQEPENSEQKTGEYLPVEDLLDGARKTPALKIDDFEQLALKNNPTIKQAQAIAGQSAALARQVGLWPNPTVGYEGEEIRGGSSRGGQQGAFVQQNIVLGGKLRRRREVFEQQRKGDELGIEEQRSNVLGAIRVQFYEALAAQKIVEVRHHLMQVALDAAQTAHQLANVGQADAPDILQTEVEAEQAQLDFVRSQHDYLQAFHSLAAVAGQPRLAVTLLQGDLDHPPEINAEEWLQTVVQQSPTLKRAEQEAIRAKAALARDKREAIPDLSLRAGVQQNRELNSDSMRPVGIQSFATASIQLPIFNRNQGNVEAARLELERAQQDVERIKLGLVRSAQPLLQRYAMEKLAAERYRTQMIPRAQRAYELYLQKYRNMAAAYPEVIISQRTFFQLQENYVRSLDELWTTTQELQNYLLTNGLSSVGSSGGARSTEINLPTSGSGGGQ